MKVLFLSVQGLSPWNQAMETEIMQRRLLAGDEIWMLRCSGQLLTCRLNPTHNLIGCAICQTRAKEQALRLNVPAHRIVDLDPSLFPNQLEAPLPTNLSSLLKLTVEGINVGRGAASTTVSFLRDYDLKPQGEHQDMLELQVKSAIGAARNYRKTLDKIKPDQVIIFNGRHVQAYPMVDLCLQRNISYVCYEAGSRFNLIEQYVDAIPHSIKSRQQTMRRMWAEASPGLRTSEAVKWYEQKKTGTNTEDRVYTLGQQWGILPKSYDPNKWNIVIFNSSEDEMKTIIEWQTDLYNHQNEVIEKILRATNGNDHIKVYVRIHPNLAEVDNLQVRELSALKFPHLTLIPAADPVDSYALMSAASVVLTFGSSIGIESTYWGKPSILYGHSFYEGLDAVYHPKSFRELMNLLLSEELAPKSKEKTLPYAYFVNNFGSPFRHVTIHSPKKVDIGGKRLSLFSYRTVPNLIRLLPQLGNWLNAHRIMIGHALRLGELKKIYAKRPK